MRSSAAARGGPASTSSPPSWRRSGSPSSTSIGNADPEGTVDYAKQVVAALPNADLNVLPDAGHMLWLDDAVHVGNAIRTFLDDSTSAEPSPTKQAAALDRP